jgi:hypothetical protein
MAETYQLFAFPAQAAARRGEWNDVAAVLDWLGSADLSCHPNNPYGPERRAEPHKLSLFALLILFDIACHNSFRMSDLNCRTVRWKPSFCPRLRDYPVAFGYRNGFPANRAVGHAAPCSQVIVEVVIKTKVAPFSHRLRNFSLRIQKL